VPLINLDGSLAVLPDQMNGGVLHTGIVFLGVGVAFLIAGPRLMYTEVTQRPRSASI
jgi:hypothetical protein